MPELPDVVVYIGALERRIVGQTLQRVRLASPFLLRSVDPPISEAFCSKVIGLGRLGKRIVFEVEGDLHLVVHLMIAGRFHWKPAGAKVPGKIGLAAFDFPSGTLILTEAGTKKRASLHLVRGQAALAKHERGGLEVLDADLSSYCARCQTGGKLLADRALSRLLKEDWPRTLEEMEEARASHGQEK